MLARMPIARAFLVGLLAAAALIVVVGFGSGPVALGGLALVLAAFAGAAVFGAGTPGWGARLGRGAVGALLSVAGALVVILASRGRNHWFDWPADSAGDLFIMLLLALAAVPGGAAAAAGPGRGLGLAGGLSLGLAAPLLLAGPRSVGLLVLLGVGTVMGTLVGALVRPRRA